MACDPNVASGVPVFNKPLPNVGAVAVTLPTTAGVAELVNVHVALAACPILCWLTTKAHSIKKANKIRLLDLTIIKS